MRNMEKQDTQCLSMKSKQFVGGSDSLHKLLHSLDTHGMVFKDLVQCMMHFRDLGRTALWDGNA